MQPGPGRKKKSMMTVMTNIMLKKQTIHVYFIVKRLIEQYVLHNYIASVNNRMELFAS